MAKYAPDQIFAPADAIRKLAEAVPTPFYVYHKQGIEDSLKQISRWFAWAEDHQNFFPLRENPTPAILRLLSEGGSGVSVCNAAELELALHCGFSGSQILYTPTRRDLRTEASVQDMGAAWLINSPSLLPDELPQKVILRYHPSDLRMPPMQARSVGRSKNGFTRQQMLDLLPQIGLQRVGLAVEVSSYNIAPGAWLKKAEVLLQLSQEILDKTGVLVDALHLGEGPGLPYRPNTAVTDPAAEAAQLRTFCEKLPNTPQIMTGISKRLLEPHGLLVSRVMEQRSAYRNFLVLDANMCQYIRPVLKQAYRHISVLGREEIEGRKLYTVVGELPDEMDRFEQKGRMLPVLTSDDYCVVHDVGCGGRSMPMLYGFQPIPAEFFLPPGWYHGGNCTAPFS